MAEELIKEGYEEYYLRVNPPTKRNYERKARGYRRRFAKLLDELDPATCLDVASGTGMFASYLRRRGHEVTGVDLNAALVDVARKNVDAEFFADDGCHFMETSGRKFDFISMLDLLEHVPHEGVVDMLKAARGALNDGGTLLVQVPNMNCLHGAGMFYVDWTHSTPFTERSLEHVARLAGFGRITHCPQFRMQTSKGKIKAMLRGILMPFLLWLRGGHKVKVHYRHLIVELQV